MFPNWPGFQVSVFTLVRRKKDNYHPLTSVASPQEKQKKAASSRKAFVGQSEKGNMAERVARAQKRAHNAVWLCSSLSLSLSLFLSFPEARSRPSVGKLFIRHSVLQMAKTEVWYPLIWGTVTLILCWRYAFFFQYCTSFWSGLSVRRLARPSPELPTIPRYSPLRCQTGRLDSY